MPWMSRKETEHQFIDERGLARATRAGDADDATSRLNVES